MSSRMRQTARITRDRGRSQARARRKETRQRKSTAKKGTSYGPPPQFASLTEAPDELRERAATEKYPWIEDYVTAGYPRGQFRQYLENFQKSPRAPKGDPPNYKTAYHWMKRFQKWGMRGLLDRVRSDAGEFKSMPTEAEALLETWATAGPSTSPQAAVSFLAEHLPDTGQDPGYDTVRRWLRWFVRENPGKIEAAGNGLAGLRSRIELSGRYPLLPGGFQLGIDSTVADFWVRVPCPHESLDWVPVRPVLTVVECTGSRFFVTFNLSLVAVNPYLMLGVLRRALVPGANWEGLATVPLPREMVFDAGSEFRGAMEATLKTLPTEVKGGEANRPQQNARVEKLLDTLQKECFKGYVGYSHDCKIFDPYTAKEQDVKRSLKQLEYDPYRLEVQPKDLLTLREAEARVLGWAQHYNMRGHSALDCNNPEVRELMSWSEARRTKAAA